MDRYAIHRRASQTALRAGLDPFEPALDAGVADACHGRLYAQTRLRHHNKAEYHRGWELGRKTLLGY